MKTKTADGLKRGERDESNWGHNKSTAPARYRGVGLNHSCGADHDWHVFDIACKTRRHLGGDASESYQLRRIIGASLIQHTMS